MQDAGSISPPLIRLATAADGPALSRIYAPAVMDCVTSFENEPPDGAEMGRRVERLAGRTPWLAFERAGNVIGYAYASMHRERFAYQWSVEVSAYVDPDSHRTGVARALYTSLFAILVLQGYRNSYAGITLPNPASVGFHEAMGFTPVGIYRGVGYKLAAWHDVVWLERPLAPRIIDPPNPKPLSEVRDTATFRDALALGLENS